MESIIVSSQRYIDDEIVSEKIANIDFSVMVSPEFEFDGIKMCVVLDGHHSLAAAKKAGVQPEWIVASVQDHDAVGLIGKDNELFLESVHMGDDYYNVESGEDIW